MIDDIKLQDKFYDAIRRCTVEYEYFTERGNHRTAINWELARNRLVRALVKFYDAGA